MGTRFVATHECDADDRFKQSYLAARAMKTSPSSKARWACPAALLTTNLSLPRAKARKNPSSACSTAHTCEQEKRPTASPRRYQRWRRATLKRALPSCGANVARVNKIISVHELMDSLQKEFDEAMNSLSKSVQNMQSRST